MEVVQHDGEPGSELIRDPGQQLTNGQRIREHFHEKGEHDRQRQNARQKNGGNEDTIS